jgi:Na+/proline symporter
MNGTTVLLTIIGYVSSLFLIAWWGDGAGRRFLSGRSRAFIYALSLAVYCTSWTYYGSVGLASAHGLDFLPIYIGPINGIDVKRIFQPETAISALAAAVLR